MTGCGCGRVGEVPGVRRRFGLVCGELGVRLANVVGELSIGIGTLRS